MAIIAYSVVHRKKVPMLRAHIMHSNGRYLAMGHDKEGNALTLFMSEKDARAAIKRGDAKKGMGFK